MNIDAATVFSNYRSCIARHLDFRNETWLLLEEILEINVIPKNSYTLEEGKVCRFIDFLYKGSFRAVHNKNGTAITTAIYTEGECITNMKSLSALIPSETYLQALEESVVARLYKEDLIKLYSLSQELQSMGRAILESMLVTENDWKQMYSLYDPAERYDFLENKAPQVLQRVPLQYIASFLGIRRETLSRIRAKRNR